MSRGTDKNLGIAAFNKALHEVVKRHGLILDNPKSRRVACMLAEDYLEGKTYENLEAKIQDEKQQVLKAKAELAKLRKLQRVRQSLRYKVVINTKAPATTQQPRVEQNDTEEPKEEPISCKQKSKSKNTKNQGKAKTFKRKSKKPGRV